MPAVTTTVLKGKDALEYAAVTGVPLNKHPDESEGERSDLSRDEAQQIAESKDPGLIWVEVSLSDPRAALLGWCARDNACHLDPDDIIETGDTVTEFIAAWGRPTGVAEFGPVRVYAWRREANPRLPKDVYLADDGGPKRFAYLVE